MLGEMVCSVAKMVRIKPDFTSVIASGVANTSPPSLRSSDKASEALAVFSSAVAGLSYTKLKSTTPGRIASSMFKMGIELAMTGSRKLLMVCLPAALSLSLAKRIMSASVILC
eukprot:TRINITY_DN12249_c0_g7_i7.p7 TRINITY_DN12249_c0_g7~~TRINITY_DN12249_c0_g7_i7.p7  ORF type:complete len:113 (-),score=18.25 TRINITY_DN12249_c0_g7_i7:3308-3646(-)